MIEVNLYGRLRRQIAGSRARGVSQMRLPLEPGDTIALVLERLGIDPEQVCTVFYNARLLCTRNRAAPIVEFRQVHPDPHAWDLDLPLQPGDHLGLFGLDMAILV